MLDYEPERDRNILKEGLLHPFPNQQWSMVRGCSAQDPSLLNTDKSQS